MNSTMNSVLPTSDTWVGPSCMQLRLVLLFVYLEGTRGYCHEYTCSRMIAGYSGFALRCGHRAYFHGYTHIVHSIVMSSCRCFRKREAYQVRFHRQTLWFSKVCCLAVALKWGVQILFHVIITFKSLALLSRGCNVILYMLPIASELTVFFVQFSEEEQVKDDFLLSATF